MARPRVIPSDEQQRERIAHYLEVLYRGNQRLLAEAVGCTQSYVSKLLSGAQRPSHGFLEALARQPLINPAWLLRGEGQPLLPATAGTLPVADMILPGPPAANTSLLSGERYPVAASVESGTRYLLRLSSASPILARAELAMLPGDLLLLEADRSIVQRLDVTTGRVCAIRVQCEGVESYVLCRVFAEAGELRAEVYGLDQLGLGAAVQRTSSETSRYLERLATPRRRRVSPPAEADETARDSSSATSPSVSAPEPQASLAAQQQILAGGVVQLRGLEDILSVVLMLERPNLSAARAAETVATAAKITQSQGEKDFDKVATKGTEKARTKN